MKKKLVATLTMIVMLMAVFLCVGCDKYEEGVVAVDPPGRVHFGGCILDKISYDVNNMTFEVYFGTLFGAGSGDAEKDIAYTKRTGSGFEYAEIYFINHAKKEKEDWYLIRRIDDYTSIEYCCKAGANSLQREAFNHHESVTIPKELLIGDSGNIGFCVIAKPRNRKDPKVDLPMEKLGGCVISYMFMDGEVLLSSNSIMRD